MIWVTLITKQKPLITARETLTSFCSRFEKLYNQELKELYSKFNGDISIFQSASLYKVSVDMIVDDEFYLLFTYPYKLASTKGKELSPKTKEVYQIAKDIALKNKGRILLQTLSSKALRILNLDYVEVRW